MKDNHAEKFETKVYLLHRIKYVPHYRSKEVYVGPGYPRPTQAQYTAAQLINAGAQEITEMMWARGAYGTVDATHL